jgi:LacI family transcriptional regulator
MEGATVVNEDGLWGALTRESGAARARTLLSAGQQVEAVLCGNDMIAVGVLDVCRERGLRVPEDWRSPDSTI